MTHRPELARNHVSSRETERLGLGLGRKIGLLDPTTKPVTDDRYARGEWDELHAQMTVVDAYSAAVDLEQLLQGGIDVVIQALGPRSCLSEYRLTPRLALRQRSADVEGMCSRGQTWWSVSG